MSVEYQTFFRAATGLDGPFDYQCRLAEDPACKSRLINIPTDAETSESLTFQSKH